MSIAKGVSMPLGSHFKLSTEGCPSSEQEMEDMVGVAYNNAIGSIIYSMIWTHG